MTLFDIETATHSLKCKGGTGPNESSPIFEEKCVKSIVWPLWLLFKKTLGDGSVPDKLKTSRAVPVFKKGDKTDVTSYSIGGQWARLLNFGTVCGTTIGTTKIDMKKVFQNTNISPVAPKMFSVITRAHENMAANYARTE